jgi:hypothetical protein
MSAASKKTTEFTLRVSSNFLSVLISFRKVYFSTTSLFFFDLQKTMKTLTFKRKSLSRKQKENNSFVSSSQKFVKCLIEGYNQDCSQRLPTSKLFLHALQEVFASLFPYFF